MFLAALAALGLPWSLTHLKLFGHCVDLTNKKTTTKTNTMAMKMTNTFIEYLQSAISETFDI